MIWIIVSIAVWLLAWRLNVVLANSALGTTAGGRFLVPAIFGVTVLVVWQGIVWGADVSRVILPAPSEIGAAIAGNLGLLWADFVQTVLKGAVSGFVIGCALGFLAAIVMDRSAFLQAGFLPVAKFISAMPIVGIAPIMVMWFGFGWQSKAAVIVVMVFFPVLINTMAGLAAADRMQRDLMATFSATYAQTLIKLRLPAAMPFIFNGLKIATTLALIGAIVAEFFGSPIVGMGFRITAEVGRLGLDMVWAEIAVAALAGSAFYGLVALVEARVTFWHPSQRN